MTPEQVRKFLVRWIVPSASVVVVFAALFAGMRYVIKAEIADILGDIHGIKSDVADLKIGDQKTNNKIDGLLKEALERAFPIPLPGTQKSELEEDFGRAHSLMQLASSESIKLSPQVLENYGKNVAAISSEPSVSNSVWPAAAELINYRSSPSNAANPEICEPNNSFSRMPAMQIVIHGCTFVLDDAAPQFMQLFQLLQSEHMPPVLILDRVHVIYRGRAIIPVRAILFVNCSFEFQISAPPPAAARSLTKILLAASDFKRIDFELPKSGE
ncbi:MAG: hypothetical protein ABR987_11145 [Terracidiphilus sp.]